MSDMFKNNGNVISVANKGIRFEKGIGEIIFEKLKENKDYVGQIDGVTGERDTYGSMLQRSIRTAIVMKEKGVKPNDIVTVCSSPHLNVNMPIIASLFIGATIASTDPNFILTDSVHMLKQVKPKMIFVSPNGVKLIEETVRQLDISPEIVVFGESSVHTEFSEFLRESPEEEESFAPVEVKDGDEMAAIFFSSGTSGLPKAVRLSQLCFISQFFTEEEQKRFAGVVCLTYTSPFWISSMGVIINGILSKGTRLILPKFDINDLYYYIEKYKINMLYLSIQYIAQICAYGKPNDVDVSQLRIFMTAGSLASKDQMTCLKKIFTNTFILNTYGLTELGGGVLNPMFSYMPGDPRFEARKSVSCGVPLAGFSYKVVDPITEEILGPNQQGELRIKTEFKLLGYYDSDVKDIYDSEGFYKTGDISYYDENYRFFIVDRIKELLKYQNWQIVPSKLESILLTHPAVESTVVVGLPSEADGDHPMAVVVLKKSVKDVSPQEIEKYVEEKVDDRQRLRGGVKIVESIPTTPSGKFKRKYMKELVLEGKL